MRKLFLLCSILFLVLHLQAADLSKYKKIPRYNKSTHQWTSYPLVSIHDIQYVPPESLHVADSLQTTTDIFVSRWQCQASPFIGDTVIVEGVVVVPASADPPHHGIIYTAHGWNMLLHDTSMQNSWAGLFVRVGTGSDYSTDTAKARANHFEIPAQGDIVRITGIIAEFPTGRLNSVTQLAPLPDTNIVNVVEIVEHDRADLIPPPTVVPITDFYHGQYGGGGKINYTNGEQYETSLIEMKGFSVNGIINTSRGTFNMVDEVPNYISDYDISYWWTIGSGETPPIAGDPGYTTPPVGAVIDSIKGSIWTTAQTENPRGYRITPLFPGDISYGVSLPTVNTQRRNPVIVTSFDTARITARALQTAGGYKLASVALYVSIDNGPFVPQPMVVVADTATYGANILDGDGNPYLAPTSVRYYIRAVDTSGRSQILANPSGSDSTKGFFFYTVINDANSLTIHNVQYTPYTAVGSSPYDGSVVTVRGIVTASDSEISASPFSSGGTSSWYIQDGSGPWNGIWVIKDTLVLPTLDSLKLGDSVSVTGKVREVLNGTSSQLRSTQIFDSSYHVYAHNRPLPAPVTINDSVLATPQNAEQYEGVLIRLVNQTVTDTGISFSDPSLYLVSDNTGGVVVRKDGINHYSNIVADTATGKIILNKGEGVDTIIGVCYYSFGSYCIVPRRDNDFVVGTHYSYSKGWNLVSVPKKQTPAAGNYTLAKLFPGTTGVAYSYASGYHLWSILYPGTGYWIKYNNATTVTQLGKKIKRDTIGIVAGWNMIGAPGSPITTGSVTVSPAGAHLSGYYNYTLGYHLATTLQPGAGYWVKSDSAGYLIETDNNAVFAPKAVAPPSAMNSVTFTDADGNNQELYFTEDAKGAIRLSDYDMPPAFNTDFDVRYASGRILETYGGDTKASAGIAINANVAKGAVTVSWNITDHSGMTYFLAPDSKVANGFTPIELKGNGAAKNVKLAGGRLYLKIGGSSNIPKTFFLSQNYPNPFNPSTRMDVGLAAPSHLTVTIYNILGQKVRTLVDEERGAGVQTLIWNGNAETGTQVASGMYFVRMTARQANGGSSTGVFTAVKKVMMMK